MRKLLKIVVPIVLVILIVNRIQILDFLGFGITEQDSTVAAVVEDVPIDLEPDKPKGDYLINDSIYRWDEVHLEWVTVTSSEKTLAKTSFSTPTALSSIRNSKQPVPIDWQLLLDIEYQRKYFQEVEMEMFAPVFSEALKAINGKEVMIEGFVIPFDETGELLALSANPFASCFFCGKASPASVISMYLKNKRVYKMDDFRKFRGVLKLNYDDPKEYYYILKDAEPVK